MLPRRILSATLPTTKGAIPRPCITRAIRSTSFAFARSSSICATWSPTKTNCSIVVMPRVANLAAPQRLGGFGRSRFLRVPQLDVPLRRLLMRDLVPAELPATALHLFVEQPGAARIEAIERRVRGKPCDVVQIDVGQCGRRRLHFD